MAGKSGDKELEQKTGNLEKEVLVRGRIGDEIVRLREKMQQHRIEHAALHETALGLMAGLDLDDLLRTIVTKAVDLAGANRGFIYLHDPENNELMPCVGVGRNAAESTDSGLESEARIAGRVWRTGELLVLNDYREWPGREPDPARDDPSSVLGAPVDSGSGVSGVVVLTHFGENRRFDENDVEAIQRFAELASIAIRGARLHSSLQAELSEKERAEEALRKSEAKYRTILESMDDGYYEIDLEGRLTFFNNALCEILGRPRDELMGMNIRECSTPESSSGINQTFGKVYKTDSTERAVGFEMVRKNGTKVFCELSISLLRMDSGKPIGFRGLARDVTETLKLRNQLLHAQKMEAMGRIASGVAHSFRNILSGISLNTQLVLSNYSQNRPLMGKMEKIRDAVKKGARLMDDLMRFTYKREDRRFEMLDLGKVISDAYNLIRPSFDKKIDVQIEYPGFLPVMGDPSGLGQVVMNLCINACDSMPDGGNLRIEARKVEKRAEVSITDSGCGMDEETRENCFTPFFTTKEVGKGTGLGLSTSYGIIKEHGGDIHVTSELNKGTSFILHFPLALGKKHQHEKNNLKIIRGKGQKVLIVDDEIGILGPMREAVESIGYRTTCVASGEEALEKYVSWRADAVLLDRNMPEMDGISCAKKLLKIDPGARIILISGYNKDGPHGIEDKVWSLIKGYLTKPMDVEKMSHLLNRTINE